MREVARSLPAAVVAASLLASLLGCGGKTLQFEPAVAPPPTQQITVTLLPVTVGKSITANPAFLAELDRAFSQRKDVQAQLAEEDAAFLAMYDRMLKRSAALEKLAADRKKAKAAKTEAGAATAAPAAPDGAAPTAEPVVPEETTATKPEASAKDEAPDETAPPKALTPDELEKIAEGFRSIAEGMIQESITESGFLVQTASVEDLMDRAAGELVRSLREEAVRVKRGESGAPMDRLRLRNETGLLEYRAAQTLLQGLHAPKVSTKDEEGEEEDDDEEDDEDEEEDDEDDDARDVECLGAVAEIISGMKANYAAEFAGKKPLVSGEIRRELMRHLGLFYTYSRSVEHDYRNACISVRLELEQVSEARLAAVALASPQASGSGAYGSSKETTAIVAYVDFSLVLPGRAGGPREEVFSRSAPIVFVRLQEHGGSLLAGLFSFRAKVGNQVYDTRQGMRSVFARLAQTLLMQSDDFTWTAPIMTRPNSVLRPEAPAAKAARRGKQTDVLAAVEALRGERRRPGADPWARVFLGDELTTYYVDYDAHEQSTHFDREQFFRLVGLEGVFLVRYDYTPYFRATLVRTGERDLTFRLDPLDAKDERLSRLKLDGVECELLGLVPSSNAAMVRDGASASPREQALYALDAVGRMLDKGKRRVDVAGPVDLTPVEGLDATKVRDLIYYFEDGEPTQAYVRIPGERMPDSVLARGWNVVFDLERVRSDFDNETDLGNRRKKSTRGSALSR